MKREAKKTALHQGILYNQALNQMAHPLGYSNWSVLIKNIQPAAIAHTQLQVFVAPKELSPKKWLTVTAISETFATTIPKVRAALKQAGYIGSDGLPSTTARSLNLVQEHTIVDSYGISTGLASYYKWDQAVAEALLPAASALDQWCHVANRFEAERQMRQTFCRASKTLGFVFNDTDEDPLNTTHPDLSPASYQALLDAHNGTMHFLGDANAFLTSRGKKGVAKVELNLRPLVANISRQLQKVNPTEALFFKDACANLLHWLGKQRR